MEAFPVSQPDVNKKLAAIAMLTEHDKKGCQGMGVLVYCKADPYVV